MFEVKPASAWAIAKRARRPLAGELARRPTRGSREKVASNRLQRVTQWMSCVTSTRGSSFSCSQVSVSGRVHLAGDA